VRERLKNYKDYADFLRAYERHRDNHEARSTLYREEGFQDLNKRFGVDYSHFEAQDDPNSAMNKDYNVYRERYYERYWDTKANDEWYSQSLKTRAWITFKKVGEFYLDLSLLCFGLSGILVCLNAKTKASVAKTR
jgi:hypothetical protein